MRLCIGNLHQSGRYARILPYVHLSADSWCLARWLVLAQCSATEAAGHTALAPDLPGHGDDTTPTASVTLKSYTDRICEIAGAQAEPVILLGHSLGGMAITQAAEICPDKIKTLVYMCAFLPRDGDSLLTWASQDKESMVNPSTTSACPDGSVVFRPEYAHDAFYASCSVEDEAFAKSRLVSQSGAVFGTPVQTTPERWGRIPRYYVECKYDRAISLDIQKAMQKESPCQRTFSIDTDHSPFFSAPEHLADILALIGTL
jgi:pimeloyl-ACP methyl ester carboxylesterase